MSSPHHDVSPAFLIKLAAVSIAILLLRMAEFGLSGAGLHVDEAQYWVWSQHLEWGYFSKPPLLVAMIKVSTALFGDSLLGVKCLSMVTWLLSSWTLGWLGYRMSSDAKTGVAAGGLFAATLISGLLGLSVTTDAPLTLFWATCMLCLWEGAHAQGRQQYLWWMACGLSFGLAVLSKYSALALGLSALWLLWLCPADQLRRVITGYIIVGCVALLALSPHLAWSIKNNWPTAQHTLDITIGESHSLSLSQPAYWLRMLASGLEFLAGQVLILGPAVWLTCVWLWRQPTQKERARSVTAMSTCWDLKNFALAFSLPILILGFIQALNAKAMINWAVPMALGVCLWLGQKVSLSQITPKRLVIYCLTGLALSGAIAVGGDLKHWAGVSTKQGQSKWDIWGRMRGWHETLQSIQPTLSDLSDTPWVTDDRSTFVHASYELRELTPQLYAWNANGGVYHHFDWKHPWVTTDPQATKFVWLSPNPPHPQLIAQYSIAKHIGTWQSDRVSLQVWLLEKGRAQP